MKKIISLLIGFVFLLGPLQTFAESNEYDKIETTKELLKALFANSDNGEYLVEGNQSGFIIRQSQKELTAAIFAASVMEDSEVQSSWNTAIDDLLSLNYSVYNFIEGQGIDNPNLLYMLTAPGIYEGGSDMIFLVISNGKIMYDFLAK